ncbi:MAG: CsgG/HfaB family protein [Sneathiella sp.]
MIKKLSLFALVALVQGGCVAATTTNVDLVRGPPVQSITTPYDDLVVCVAETDTMDGTWAVGQISDQTGKYTVDNDGTGKFVSQGAGDMMQTMLLQAGAESTVNRRDPRPSITEVKWGIRKPIHFKATDYYITGSINTLDFLPGMASELLIGGVGPRYLQNRTVVGLDLHLTDARTTEVIGAVNISKQIFAEEAGFGIGRFFGVTLVDFDINGGNREPLQLSLRSMLQFGLYKLLVAQDPMVESNCQHIVDSIEGVEDKNETNEYS